MGCPPWTDDQLRWIIEVIRQHSTISEACLAISKATGRSVTSNNLLVTFRRKSLGEPRDYLKPFVAAELPGLPKFPTRGQASAPEIVTPPPASGAPPPPSGPDRFALFRTIKGKAIAFDELCDRLGLPPKKARELIAEAQAAGMSVQLENGLVGLDAPAPSLVPQETGILPVVGERQVVGIISDTHLGSKYCLRAQLRDFVLFAYHERGVREILHPGDVLDGHYKKNGQMLECSHVGLDAQCADLFETLPELPGLTYHAITGNHDETFWAETGHDTGHAIERYFRHPPNGKKPRNDLKFYGNRGANLMIRGARIHLWHPRSGKSYARTYHLQRLATMYAGGAKPQITLAGHWHVSAYCVERGIHLIACPTFQGGGSAFGKSLGGAPEIGGLILDWQVTKHGTIRNFRYERRAYFEVEEAQETALAPGVHEGFGE